MSALMGQMMNMPLMISALLKHAARHAADTEGVSKRVEGDLHRTTWAGVEQRARQLAHALAQMGHRLSPPQHLAQAPPLPFRQANHHHPPPAGQQEILPVSAIERIACLGPVHAVGHDLAHDPQIGQHCRRHIL